MSAVTAAIAAMRAKGMDPSDILDVVQAIADAEVAPVEKLRSQAAERQLRYRERNALRNVTSRYVTDESVTRDVTTVTNDVTRYDASLSKKDNIKTKREKRNASRITDDWKPSVADLAYAAEKGLSPEQTASEIERFRNHWLASGKTWVDWTKVWQNWILRTAEFKGIKPSAAPSSPVEAFPQFKTREEHQAWWDARHDRLVAEAASR